MIFDNLRCVHNRNLVTFIFCRSQFKNNRFFITDYLYRT